MRNILILDFDGVVTDTEPLNYSAWTTMFARELGLSHLGDHTALVGLTLDEIFKLWMPEPPDTETKEHLLTLKNELYFTLAGEQLSPMPGCIDLVRRAMSAGAYCVVVSRSRRVRLLRTLDILHFPAIFDAVLGYEDAVDPLTERKIHARAADMFKADPADCIVVEDSASGIRDALACGIGRVVGLTTSLSADTLARAGAHQVVADLDSVTLW